MGVQKKIGNEYESKLLNLLQERGWWCHLLAYNPNGQPCDVIALKNDKGMMIDVKHCALKSFPFYRIESNQKSCFKYASMVCENKNVGFAIFFELDGKWRWLPYEQYEVLSESGCKSVSYFMLVELKDVC